MLAALRQRGVKAVALVDEASQAAIKAVLARLELDGLFEAQVNCQHSRGHRFDSTTQPDNAVRPRLDRIILLFVALYVMVELSLSIFLSSPTPAVASMQAHAARGSAGAVVFLLLRPRSSC